tara:strand:- start:25930 stop:27306 length:1377 start_codon:yes stop_codon:yes gene_type:complete
MIDISEKERIDIKEKSLSIIGIGRSGSSAAQLAHYLGARVFASDLNTGIASNVAANELFNLGIGIETGVHSNRVYDSDLCVVSPGIPKNSKIITAVLDRGIPIVGEIEFASWFTSSPIIAVTGSNGKTTTVNLLKKIFESENLTVAMAGNIGIPFSSLVLSELKNPNENTVYILEISSFQMEFVKHFRPKFGVFTNISKDHLDRHQSMNEYIKTKMKMVSNQEKSDFIIYNLDDAHLVNSLRNNEPKSIPFSIKNSDTIFKFDHKNIYYGKNEILVNVKQLKLLGIHNIYNILAASTVANLFGISKIQIKKALIYFEGVEHRLEFVSKINDVEYYNDSKATNMDAVFVAVNSFMKPILLILGGRNKGADFRQLKKQIDLNKIKQIISYGESGGDIVTAIGDAVRSEQVADLISAVTFAQSLAIPGDVVLLSPGCASYDQYSNYEERGAHFKELVSSQR